jgi:hypothetical protein
METRDLQLTGSRRESASSFTRREVARGPVIYQNIGISAFPKSGDMPSKTSK